MSHSVIDLARYLSQRSPTENTLGLSNFSAVAIARRSAVIDKTKRTPTSPGPEFERGKAKASQPARPVHHHWRVKEGASTMHGALASGHGSSNDSQSPS